MNYDIKNKPEKEYEREINTQTNKLLTFNEDNSHKHLLVIYYIFRTKTKTKTIIIKLEESIIIKLMA